MFCFDISQFLIYYSQSSMETDNLFSYFWVFSCICLSCSSILDELVFELVLANFLIKFVFILFQNNCDYIYLNNVCIFFNSRGKENDIIH